MKAFPRQHPGFAPKGVFDLILKWAVIPTFDLVIEYGNKGVVFVKRKIAPYKNLWALPGLRMLKGETIEETLTRIAKQEVGLRIDPRERIFLGQFVGKFKTEQNRQDLSTGNLIKVDSCQEIRINKEHFVSFKIVNSIPKPTGAMYKYYLKQYFAFKK